MRQLPFWGKKEFLICIRRLLHAYVRMPDGTLVGSRRAVNPMAFASTIAQSDNSDLVVCRSPQCASKPDHRGWPPSIYPVRQVKGDFLCDRSWLWLDGRQVDMNQRLKDLQQGRSSARLHISRSS